MAGIYIHIPLCKTKCRYCDFYSITDVRKKDYLIEEILTELGRERGYIGNEPINTIYFGGGTPSLIEPYQIQTVIDKIRSLWLCSGLTEMTLEANPDDLTQEYLQKLTESEVNRLSIGIQSFNDKELSLLGRRHNSEQARTSVLEAQNNGFRNISIDLMYGLPGMTRDGWLNNLNEAIGMNIQHISAYHLTYEKNTVLGKMLVNREVSETDERESEEQYKLLTGALSVAGFEQYEISNFAKQGFRSRHNSSYWQQELYLGIGPSAHSYNGRTRRWNKCSVRAYLSKDGARDIYKEEVLTKKDVINEYIMTSLRCTDGIDLTKFSELFGEEFAVHIRDRSNKYLEAGIMSRQNGRLYIIPEKLLISDTVISDMFVI